MKQITVISGKGGTGKTVITAAFAALAKNKVMADSDVDASDLHLLLHPHIRETHQFKGGMGAILDEERCTGCDKCIEVCRFDAIREEEGQGSRVKGQGMVIIDPVACEGCQICALVCPTEAIQMEENVSGEWYISETKYGPMVHARLGIAQENSGKLVSVVRKNAREIAQRSDLKLVIVDGPPGIGCPVIASITGVDLVVIVTEPTFSAISDLKRVFTLTQHFRIQSMVLINKSDLNPENTKEVEDFCRQEKIELAGKLPFDNAFTQAMVEGKTIIEHSDSNLVKEIKSIWDRIHARITKEVF
ncbi:MAG: P-loop NTPase [Candidatus Zixiibacteriota bacterium]